MKKRLFLFSLGAIAYPLLELGWRGRSHWTMALAGGICLPLLERIRRCRCSLLRRALRGACSISLVELAFGCVCNKLLGWNVWDYSRQPLNLWGQICLPFSLAWFLLCFPVFALLRCLHQREG